MRSCDEILDLISAALDGQLNADEQAALEEHLTHCSACSALYNDLYTLQTVTVDIEEISAPAGFADAVMSAIAADPTQEQPDNVIPISAKKKSRIRWNRWAASAAAVVVVAAGVVAFPNLMRGNSSNFDAAMANTANYSKAESAVADQAAPECFTEENTSSSITYDYAEYEAQAETYNGAAEDAVVETAPAASAEPAEQVSNALADSIVYCGVLTLSDTALPEGLDKFEVTEDDQGNLTYVVPAEYFYFTLNNMRTEEKTTTSTPELGDTDTGAEYGLIIVEKPS